MERERESRVGVRGGDSKEGELRDGENREGEEERRVRVVCVE